MKRIVLTPVVEGYATEFLRDLRGLTENPRQLLWDLENQLPSPFSDYVRAINRNYGFIITAKPDEMDVNNGVVATLFNGCNVRDMAFEFPVYWRQNDGIYKQVKKKFYQLVTDALCYDDVQEKIFPKYVKKLGIKSCVYCNAQYVISAKRGKTDAGKNYRATFTIDHYWPKSKYPHLATSFFNLYPTCATCNQTKSARDPIFELYVKPTDPVEERNPFEFRLDKASFVKYSMSGDADDLEIKFGTRTGIPAQRATEYENYFHVEKLYGNLKDTVEEVIWKYRVYNKAGRQALKDSYEHLLPHESDWNRFVLGNYDREEDIHKRPLAKLVQDVAKQLGVI